MRITGYSSLLHGGSDLLQLGLQDVARNAGQHQQKFIPAVADEQIGVSDAGADGICRCFQCHISGVMPIGVVADFEIVHIDQRDSCRADHTGCDILIVAAVVCASQDILVKFCTVAFCCFLKLFLCFGLHLFHAGALELPLQTTDQQNVRSDTKADHDELLKVQRGVKKKAVVGRKEKRGV